MDETISLKDIFDFQKEKELGTPIQSLMKMSKLLQECSECLLIKM